MQISITPKLTDAQFAVVDELWNKEYPAKLMNRLGLLTADADNCLHYLVYDRKEIIAWAVWFQINEEIRFSILVHESHQKQGIGKLLVDALKNDLNEFYGWVIDHNNDLKKSGDNYLSPLEFYKKLGFEVLPQFRIDNEMLNAVKIRWSKKLN